MKLFVKRLCLVLVVVMLLTSLSGCTMLTTLLTVFGALAGGSQSATSGPTNPVQVLPTDPVLELPELGKSQLELKYELTEEELTKVDQLVETCKTVSYDTAASREQVEAAWDELETQLDYVSDQVQIAQVVYYLDTTNEAANQTYLDAYDEYLALADKANLLQKDMYEASPVKDWFFEDWKQVEIDYLLSYTTEQSEIQAQLNEIDTKFVELSDDALHEDYTALYIQMVTLGNQMARLAGYENYYDYRAALGFSRDYSEAQREQFRGYVKTVIMPQFGAIMDSVLSGAETLGYQDAMFFTDFSYNDFDDLDRNYLQEYIYSHSGSTFAGMIHLFDSGNYIATDDYNAYEGAFCGSFDYYDMAICYFGPGYQSTFTVVHELGHYYASEYADDYTSYDLLETHSQGNEALMLAYIKDLAPAGGYKFLRDYELFDMMLTMIIASMVDEYEQRIYTMDSVANLTTADIDAIINEICDEYFGAYGGADYMANNVTDMQWYIRKVTGLSPAYYISYATSVVTSLNLFALAEQDATAARELYRKLVEEAPLVEGYEAALQSVGAASPFDEKSFHIVVELFQ